MLDHNSNIYCKGKRHELIAEIVRLKKITNYLEIGCYNNETFSVVNVPGKKIGVDPVSGGTHKMTSDEFFETNNETFDLVFIDGLHTYDQVSKDFLNSVKALNPNGIIVIHDMYPIEQDWATDYDENTKHKPVWLGDVWRLAFDLKELHNAKKINFCLGFFNFGCGIVYDIQSKDLVLPKVIDKNDWNVFQKRRYELELFNFRECITLLEEN